MSTRGPPKRTLKTQDLPQHCSALHNYLAVGTERQNNQPVLGIARLGNNMHILVVALARTVLNAEIPEDVYK